MELSAQGNFICESSYCIRLLAFSLYLERDHLRKWKAITFYFLHGLNINNIVSILTMSATELHNLK